MVRKTGSDFGINLGDATRLFMQSTSSPQESPASQPLSLDLGLEPTTSDGSGHRLLQSYEHFVPGGSWQRTLLDSLVSTTAVPCPRFSMKWRGSATRCKRLLFEHVRSADPINVPECSSSADMWATATGRDYKDTGAGTNYEKLKAKAKLSGEVTMWATLQETEARQGFMNRARGKKGTQKNTTTEASEWMHGAAEPGPEDKTKQCATLNPRFALWLMGFPADWLDESPP